MDNEPWIDLCAIADLPVEGGHYLVHDGRALALWRLDDKTVRVMDDACPHAGGSLSAGYLDSQSGCVVCPWHAWPFDVKTGLCPDNEALAVRIYPARVDAGRVMAALATHRV